MKRTTKPSKKAGGDLLSEIAHLSDYDQLQVLADHARQEPVTTGKPQGTAPNPANWPTSQALTAAQAAKRPGNGKGARSLSPLARAIRNAYKGAKPGQHGAHILRRIGDARPKPGPQEIARALVASGIPAHRAAQAAKEWDIVQLLAQGPAIPPQGETHPGKWDWEELGRLSATWRPENTASFLKTIYHAGREDQRGAIILGILRGIEPRPSAEQAETLLSGIPERDRMVLVQHYKDWLRGQERGAGKAKGRDLLAQALEEADPETGVTARLTRQLAEMQAKGGREQPKAGEARETFDRLHKAKAEGRDVLEAIAGPDPLKLASKAQEEDAEALPKTAEECPAYVKRAFDSAAPDRIADVTGWALFEAWPIWAPGRNLLNGYKLLEEAKIPREWHTKIERAASDAQRNAEEIAREEEIDRRKAAAPKAEAEAGDPFGGALKVITDSGYSVSLNGKALDLQGAPLWQRQGICIQPGEIKDIRAQADVLIGLVDGLTNLLAERDPEDRETRKLSALREQADNLIGLLDPILAGEGGG